MIFNKTTACGYSSIGSMLFSDGLFKFHHLIAGLDRSISKHDFPVLISQVSLVCVPEKIVMASDKLFDFAISRNRLADVIDLSSCVLQCGVVKENDEIRFIELWGDIYPMPFWSLPDTMELRLDQNAPPSMDAPAKLLFSAVSEEMLWNDRKTFINWLGCNRSQWNEGRLFRRDAFAES